MDVITIEKTSSNINSKSVIEEFIQAGNQLKKQQIEVLTQNNFELLAQKYKNDPVSVFRYIVWTGSTLIQVFCFPGQLQTKLPMIISSLIRDCHLSAMIGIYH